MSDFVTVANKDELKPGECKVVEADDKVIALYNVDNTFYATDNICLHRGGPLGDGELNGKIVTCPWHRWDYDVTTGENTANPDMKVETFEVRMNGVEVQVKI